MLAVAEAVFRLSVWESLFKVNIYFPEKARAEVMNIQLDNEVKEMILASKVMGKLKHFPVSFEFSSDEIFEAFFCSQISGRA